MRSRERPKIPVACCRPGTGRTSRVGRSASGDQAARVEALWWTPRVHLAIFVHRVVGVAPGLYLLPRAAGAIEKLRAAFGREFLWEEAHDHPPLVGLARGDCRRLAERLSCDQAI